MFPLLEDRRFRVSPEDLLKALDHLALGGVRARRVQQGGHEVGVPCGLLADDGEGELELLHIDPALERKQIDRVQGVRARRDSAAVEQALTQLREAAAGDANLMPNLLDCARVHATEGEIVESLQRVFGTYTETPVF